MTLYAPLVVSKNHLVCGHTFRSSRLQNRTIRPRLSFQLPVQGISILLAAVLFLPIAASAAQDSDKLTQDEIKELVQKLFSKDVAERMEAATKIKKGGKAAAKALEIGAYGKDTRTNWRLRQLAGATRSRSLKDKDFAKHVRDILEAQYVESYSLYQIIMFLGERVQRELVNTIRAKHWSKNSCFSALGGFAERRLKLTDEALQCLRKEIRTKKPSWSAIYSLGVLGDNAAVGDLIKISEGEDQNRARHACIALAMIGSEKAVAQLTKLSSKALDEKLQQQCTTLLGECIKPFSGKDAASNLIKAVEKGERVTGITTAAGYGLYLYDIALRRIVREKRVEVTPKLRKIVSEQWTKKQVATTTGDRKLVSILTSIHLLGGKLSQEETELLRAFSHIEEPKE